MGHRIFANHAHVFPASMNPNGTTDRLLRLMDACGIEEAVCFAPFPQQCMGTNLEPNSWLQREISRHDRLYGFGTVDLNRRDVRDQVKRIHDLGLKGIKMHPNAQQFDILYPAAFEAYGAAQDLKLFITFHSGVHHYRIKHYNVLSFDEVAHHFPDLRFSLEHVGGYCFFFEALAVIVNNIPFPPVPGRRPRVYGGMSSIFTQHYNRFWYMSRDRMIELVAQAGPEQLIFGLDFPYNLEENTLIGLRTIESLDLTEQQRGLILGGNLREALGLTEMPTEPARVPAVAAAK